MKTVLRETHQEICDLFSKNSGGSLQEGQIVSEGLEQLLSILVDCVLQDVDKERLTDREWLTGLAEDLEDISVLKPLNTYDLLVAKARKIRERASLSPTRRKVEWTDDKIVALARKAKVPHYLYDTPNGLRALSRMLALAESGSGS